ncbi:TLD-domain-containing protein, partial [Neocallimastix californiae]
MQLHGSSLSTFYERSNAGYGTSQILVIRDTDDNIFGAYTSEPFRKNNGFYGNGETFLWKVEPCVEKKVKGHLKLYLWKQTNYFFINSTNEYVSVGSGGGTYGLWFDQQMLHGRSQVCETFKNDILSTQENFEIVDMELWSF